ncbi:hypothetical protein [Paenibacillus glycanilyticus]|uniref:hypothetical protein n=1 Tax=Paenibacillus glycanilyticus TaxID=126569 RepID=UPI001910AFBF|nr:hypothetical protein [Paenibacillus glycanilyticus]
MMIVQKLSRHLAIPVGIIAILLIGFFSWLNHAHQNAGTLYIKDHFGDRSAIDPIRISGDISDQYASMAFEINKGKLMKHTEVYDPPLLLPDHYKYVNGGKKRIDNLEYEVHGEGAFYVLYTDKNLLNVKNNGKSSLVYTKIAKANADGNYVNPLEYGLAKVGDHLYFTVPTAADSTGTNGIYELSFAEEGTTRTVTEFSLDQNKEGASLAVLGLAAAGDKLALILKENGHVVVRGYDPVSGKMLGNIRLDPSGSSYSNQYEAYTNDKVLNLVFQNNSVQTDYNTFYRKAVWSIDFHNGMQLADATTLDYASTWKDYYRSRMNMQYLDGRLYLVYTFTEPRPEDRFEGYLPIHLMIRVYKANQLLYEGELVSDLNDDLVNTFNWPEGESYDLQFYDYRLFDHLKLERGKGE